MNARPLVSIVLPTRDRSPALRSCLEAILQQPYRPLEIVIVDDGSTDGTAALLDQCSSSDPSISIRPFRNPTPMGANPSRNRGIRECAGTLIAFLDDDAFPEPCWLERLVRAFASERVAATTGRVENAPATNLYELALKGTQRVAGRTQASRLVGCNMCVRRDILERFRLDEDRAGALPDSSVSGRGDEEGLFLTLRAAGYEQRVVHDAVVIHHHRYTRRSFFRQAYRSGIGTARLGYKYYLPPRVELVPLFLAWVTLPLVALNVRLGVVPAAFAAFFLAAILYNELFRKAKTPWETFITLPLVIAFYHARLVGYVGEYIRLRTRKHGLQRVRLPREGPPQNAHRT